VNGQLPSRQLAVALAPRDTATAQQQLRNAALVADLAELRLDLMEGFDLPAILADRPCPVIVTCRPVREGGRYAGDEQRRLDIVRQAIELGADYVDVEADSVASLGARGATRLIVSHHDFEHLPADLFGAWRRLREAGADVVKLVGMARDARDNVPMLDLLAAATAPTIALCMGPLGLPSRVLALRYPQCFLTFAALEDQGGTAPGQISAACMRARFRARDVGPGTRAYGIRGPPGQADADYLTDLLTEGLVARGLDAVAVPWPGAADPAALLRATAAIVDGWLVGEDWQGRAWELARRGEGDAELVQRCSALHAGADGLLGYWSAGVAANVDWLADRALECRAAT
jgi:3-dehydroquinate dehydratase type I